MNYDNCKHWAFLACLFFIQSALVSFVVPNFLSLFCFYPPISSLLLYRWRYLYISYSNIYSTDLCYIYIYILMLYIYTLNSTQQTHTQTERKRKRMESLKIIERERLRHVSCKTRFGGADGTLKGLPSSVNEEIKNYKLTKCFLIREMFTPCNLFRRRQIACLADWRNLILHTQNFRTVCSGVAQFLNDIISSTLF